LVKDFIGTVMFLYYNKEGFPSSKRSLQLYLIKARISLAYFFFECYFFHAGSGSAEPIYPDYWFRPEFHWVSEFRFANKKEDKRDPQRKKVKINVLQRGFV
jgi:hypothetical protein